MKKRLYHFFLVIRSFTFYMILAVATFFYGIFCLFCYRLPEHVRYEIIKLWTGFMVYVLRYVCGIKYEVHGLENLPEKNAIILSKHQSTYETFLFPNIFHQPTIVLKKELLNIPFFGWGLRLLDPIALDRKKPSSAMEQVLSIGAKKIKQGRWVLIFPESMRVKPGQKARYRIGGALLAEKTQTMVVPVAHNAGHCWPRKSFVKQPGTVKVVIGKPIDVTNRSAEEILAKVKSWIESTMEIISPSH